MVDVMVQIGLASDGKILPFASSFDKRLAFVVSRYIMGERSSMIFNDNAEIREGVQEDIESLGRLFKKVGL